MLHIHPKDKEAGNNQAVAADTNTAVGSALVVVQTSGLTGAGKQDCKLSIVPVKVKSKKGHKIVETYAFLESREFSLLLYYQSDELAKHHRKRNQDSLTHYGLGKGCEKLHCIRFGGSWPG